MTSRPSLASYSNRRPAGAESSGSRRNTTREPARPRIRSTSPRSTPNAVSVDRSGSLSATAGLPQRALQHAANERALEREVDDEDGHDGHERRRRQQRDVGGE